MEHLVEGELIVVTDALIDQEGILPGGVTINPGQVYLEKVANLGK